MEEYYPQDNQQSISYISTIQIEDLANEMKERS